MENEKPSSDQPNAEGSKSSDKKKDESQTWLQKNLIAVLALDVSLVNLYFYYTFNSRNNAVLKYVGLANFSIHPRSAIFMTMPDAEYDKIVGSRPEGQWSNGIHKFVYHYTVFDSTRNVYLPENIRTYELDKIRKYLD